MEIKNMNFEELETRRAELAAEIPTADAERLDAINAELDAIEERKQAIKAEAEERAKAVEEVINAPEPTPIIEERTEHKMTSREIRSTQEYIDAYVEYVKRGYDLDKVSTEARETLIKGMETRMPSGDTALLKTENVSGGKIAVPVYVEEKINTAWEQDNFMSRIRRTFFPGNVKVGVEVMAGPAVIHAEGGEAIAAEELAIEYINLVPEYIKKMVKVSHTALALKGTAFLDYLYDELEHQIVLKAKGETIDAIVNSAFVGTYTMAGATLTTADLIGAQGLLAGNANDLALLIRRADAAALKAAALSANYGYDPFDGLDVIYCDCDPIIVDLDAVQANFPEGDTPKFIFDEYTEAPANVVRIIARLLMAAALVRTGAAVAIAAE